VSECLGLPAAWLSEGHSVAKTLASLLHQLSFVFYRVTKEAYSLTNFIRLCLGGCISMLCTLLPCPFL
jgi:hypothetical protein